MARYAIGLGSNLGDRLQHLRGAHDELRDQFEVLAVSPLYETEPVGGPDQDPFLNAVIIVGTDRTALEVLDVCQGIERNHGRERSTRWGPRTLDLDIITTDGSPHADDRLAVPHPRASEREFVLRPLFDVWPDAPLGQDLTAGAALAGVGDQEVDRLSDQWLPEQKL